MCLLLPIFFLLGYQYGFYQKHYINGISKNKNNPNYILEIIKNEKLISSLKKQIMKYRIRYIDSSLLFFTPFSFLNMGGCDHWVIEAKKHWWNKWKTIHSYDNKKEAEKKLKKLVKMN